MKKRILSMLLAGGLILSLAACGGDTGSNNSAAPQDSTAPTTGSTAPEDSKAPEGPAEATGKLVIYSPNSDTQINSSLEAFKKAYPGIEVELQSMGTGDVLARIEAEKENPQADINWGAINYNFYEQHPDLWEEYVSPNDELLDENYRNHAGCVSFGNLSGSGAFILNDDMLAELGVEVKGYADLLNPKLKGKIAMGDPTASSSAFAELTNMLLVMGEGETADECYHSDKAWQFVKDFVANLDGIILNSSSAVYKNVVAGEYAVGVSYEDPVVQAVLDNKDNPDANISMVYPAEGAVWLPAGVAIVKNAPNMDNAKLFVDFMLSEECQKELAKTTIRGTITSIPQDCEGMLPFDEINVAYEDQAAVAAYQTEMLQKWTDIVTGG